MAFFFRLKLIFNSVFDLQLLIFGRRRARSVPSSIENKLKNTSRGVFSLLDGGNGFATKVGAVLGREKARSGRARDGGITVLRRRWILFLDVPEPEPVPGQWQAL